MPFMQQVEWKKMSAVIAAIVGVAVIGDYFRRPSTSLEKLSGSSAERPELRTIITTQSADGVAEAQLTQEVAKAWEKYAVDQIATKAVEVAKARGLPAERPSVKSTSILMQVNDRRLVVVRMILNETVRAAEILGIEGTRLVRVLCVRDNPEEILLTNGACADKIYEAFQVRL